MCTGKGGVCQVLGQGQGVEEETRPRKKEERRIWRGRYTHKKQRTEKNMRDKQNE